jgi:hypothetical protein
MVRSRLLHPLLGVHEQKDCRCRRQGLTHPCRHNSTGKTRYPASGEAGAVARFAVGMMGMGTGKSESRSVMERIGAAISAPPRKRADFQWVIRYERADRIFTEGKSK